MHRESEYNQFCAAVKRNTIPPKHSLRYYAGQDNTSLQLQKWTDWIGKNMHYTCFSLEAEEAETAEG